MAATKYPLYRRLPGLVLGFLGCDRQVGERILRGEERHLKPSSNAYDWLGTGIYFWESDPQRAFEFAEEAARKPHQTKGQIKEPFVIGAAIDLGYCLNMLDRAACEEARVAFDTLCASVRSTGQQVPVNKGNDLAARFRDRAVVETLHAAREMLDQVSPGSFPPYESVRAAFLEGGSLYEGAGFSAKNHIQVAIRNPVCIRGYFRPLSA